MTRPLVVLFAAALSICPAELEKDPAVRLALEDLQEALAARGAGASRLTLMQVPDLGEQEYEWRNEPALELRAATPLGAAFGVTRLTWLARTGQPFPPPARREAPALPHRFVLTDLGLADTVEGPPGDPADVARVTERFRSKLREALRFSQNYVMVSGMENYIPWEEPVYGPRAERYRRYLAAAVSAAHQLHLKLLLYGDEAIFLPSWLERFQARPSVKDPRFWSALQEKYRRLFRAVPELDGISTRIGEMLPKYDFQALDLVHTPEQEPSPRIEERYRTYIRRIQDVVSGEFGKLFVHRTWVTNDWEQHSVPDVYRDTFTPQVPVRGLMLAIKLTKQDQWYYGSAFNPTFGQTPHATAAQGELYSGYHGFGTIVDFPARWFGAAMQHARVHGTQGTYSTFPNRTLLAPGMFYVWSRLAWNPDADVETITREWAAVEFGPAAAEEIARILLISGEAVRHGFYLAPVSLQGWAPLPHIRVNKFVAYGDPLWDKGRGHDQFLRGMHLALKPYYEDTYSGVGRGYEIATGMLQRFESARGRIQPSQAGDRFGELLRHGVAAMALARDYTRLFLSYFAYREQPVAERRERLARDCATMKATAADYRARFHFYDLAGIDQTIELASRMLDNRDAAERTLREAPTPGQIAERFRAAREHDAQLLASGRGERILAWTGTLDGRAILRIRNGQVKIETLTGDGVGHPLATFDKQLESKAGGLWAIRRVRVRGIAYLLEAPSDSNGHTASIYLDDPDSGSSTFVLELWWLPER